MTLHLRALTPDDAAAAAALHALAFADGWSEAAFAAQFAAAGAVTLGLFDADGLAAFALFQNTAGEADLLTVATHPDRRNQGLARQLITRVMADLVLQAVTRVTLDVAEDNAPALHLYASLGFTEDGRRPRYYTAGRPAPVAAILMSKTLAA
ncbi:MAG: GNAT family N-acetyltransferase [Hyphomonas sp.]|uniref:GNAT family N-acetyltransferase n=1 Tax=Hyphomonas sp. TaxID=87 RepID=UPI00179FF601|nr:GNAT family N-acetyltransferase [Hyphomonas sp.]MBU3920390.1 GNAT family N-acetyltransferase [Alphaproteobacteria bacterium]MBA3068290.1 GNAT family N-acetyltransferase [Hyphomonas sp.]MBU4060844.1 GNAT family N-acetyltransferase [Alphaproteobacteria bacterium]MBU4164828.1 GNAT family N-acetyltransferase [Alphaproteobacteria bacterium]MBU4568731.1 GNAT family N-acetyltransferase [Alphaproteobacteria bacterium]